MRQVKICKCFLNLTYQIQVSAVSCFCGLLSMFCHIFDFVNSVQCNVFSPKTCLLWCMRGHITDCLFFSGSLGKLELLSTVNLCVLVFSMIFLYMFQNQPIYTNINIKFRIKTLTNWTVYVHVLHFLLYNEHQCRFIWK